MAARKRISFRLSILSLHNQRRMTCAHHTCSAGRWLQGHAHCRHERARTEDASKIMIDRAHDFARRIVFGCSVLEKQRR